MTEKPLERRLQTGLHITRRNDPLREITLKRLYEGIRHSKEPLRDAIEQLRAVKSVDENQYRQMKTGLPYFVCGVFHPPVRRLENLAAMHYLLLDLDHLGHIDTTPHQLRQRLRADERLVMDFVSPGGDGLKLLFALSEPVFDAELFRRLYKWFALQFAEQYGLQEVVDMRTHDPTRACFLSADPEARLNEQAVPVDVAAFRAALEDGQLRQIETRAREVTAQRPAEPKQDAHKGPDDETLRKIKE
ncbi:MAG: virulence protein E, partial [Bacteroidetes bacterium]